jgi:hypothetical protein
MPAYRTALKISSEDEARIFLMEEDASIRASRGNSAWLSTFQTGLPFLTLVGGALWALFTYID